MNKLVEAATTLDTELTSWLEQINVGKNPNNRDKFCNAFAQLKIALSEHRAEPSADAVENACGIWCPLCGAHLKSA